MRILFRALSFAALLAPLPSLAQSISGTLFEDVNYGGGAGRSITTANAVRTGSAVPLSTAATVELYNASGNFVATTTTSTAAATLGQYSFTGLAAGTYTVRVVNNTVRSIRAGSTSALLPVQTYVVRNGAGDVNRVGGEAPNQVDGPVNSASGTTLQFQGLNNTGDNSAFVDLVEIRNSSNAVVAGAVANASFETPSLGSGSGAYQYSPTGGQWNFVGGSGIAANGSAFNSTAPGGGGTQVAFLQNTGNFQQTLSLAVGTYTVRFQAIQRTTNNQSVQVLINGVQVASVTPAQGSYTTYTSSTFTVGATANLGSFVAQSQAPVTIAGTTTVTGVDFGFSFNVVSNTNDTGQGSLRQFIVNTNALDNTTVRQQGLAARRNTSVFMIPDGQAHPGLRVGLADQLTGPSNSRRALISPATTLPTITGVGTVIDGTTQTTNVGNTNTAQLGTGGTVGTNLLTLDKINGPEVELSVAINGATCLTVAADSCTLRSVAVHGGATGITMGGNGAVLEGNLIGITALAVAQPTTAPVTGIGLRLTAPTASLRNNLIGYNGNSGLNYSAGNGTTGVIIRNNEFVQNGQITAGGDALSIGDQGAAGPVLIEGNLISLSNSSGIQFEIGSVSNNIVRNNTISANGTGGTSSRLEGSGIHYLARTNTVSSTNTDLITRNLITRNQSSGIVINYGQRKVQITQNSIFLNGDGTIPGAAGLLSIDFTGPNGRVGGDANYGQGDGVTPNDGLVDAPGTATSQIPPYRQGNGGIDYPIITNISKDSNGKLRVQGYVGSAPGQSKFGGATVEIYSANNTDTNQNGPIIVGDGKSVAHGEAQNYVATLTADAAGNFDVTLNSVATNISPGDIITATAYLAAYGTSECGINQTSTFTVLPVQLTEFTATAQSTRVHLRWVTASELHNNRFEIERSVNARNFERVGTVAGQGTSNQGHTYAFLDTPPTAGLLYYRLRQVDTDGASTYSGVQTVQVEPAAKAVSVRPNPTAGRIEVDLTWLPGGPCQLVVRDIRGQVVYSATATAGAVYPLDLLKQSAGIYILTLTGAGQTFTERIVKTE